jgi:hypothetical protein
MVIKIYMSENKLCRSDIIFESMFHAFALHKKHKINYVIVNI